MALTLGLVHLNILQGQEYRELSNKNCIRLLPQAGARGKILDRDARVMVDNKLSYDVMVLARSGSQLESALQAVGKVLEKNPNDLRRIFKKGHAASSLATVVAENIDIKKAIALEELKSDIPGVIIQARPIRHYPNGSLASHLVGYLNEIDRWRLTQLEDYGYKTKDIVGFGGVEEEYDFYLREEEGGLSVEVDHLGRFTRILGFKPPYSGKDVQLTIDLRVQKIVEDKLADRKGAVVIMDPATGQIIAMASGPGFSPSVFVTRSSSAINDLFRNSDGPLINRAISAAYAPGSIFKTVAATAGLETGKLNLSTSFLCTGVVQVGRQEFKCWNVHGEQGLIKAIAHSCNSYFYHTGLLLGAPIISDYALKLGLGKPTGIELPYEAGGFVPSPLWKKIYKFKNWYDGDTVNLSIGQGDVLVTPLQAVRMISVFANKGFLVAPYVVKSVGGKDFSLYHNKQALRLPIKESTLDYVREGLRQVVAEPSGTGSVMGDLAVPVAGKTGTAQAPPGLPHAWFAGFFPYKSPKYSICVFLEHAGSGYVSCVLTKQIIAEMVSQGLI